MRFTAFIDVFSNMIEDFNDNKDTSSHAAYQYLAKRTNYALFVKRFVSESKVKN